MPVHDWTKADAATFHDFHQAWTIELRNALNGGGLPYGYFALAEQSLGGPIPDAITLQKAGGAQATPHNGNAGAVAVIDAPPRAQFVTSLEKQTYADKANRLVVKHRLGRVVAVIEIVSPGNKVSQHALRAFVEKAAALLRQGIHLLVVDLFPPTSRDPQGIHKAICDEFENVDFKLPSEKPLTIAAYCAGETTTAYVDTVGVGDPLPPAPIFLDPYSHVLAPLESSYMTTWSKCPDVVRGLVEGRGT